MSEWPHFVQIYAIEHVLSGKAYVGSSKQFHIRQGEHLKGLRAGNHHSPLLQNLWNKYGEKQFRFIILDQRECTSVEDRVAFEVHFVNLRGNLNARLPTPDNTGFTMSLEGRKSVSNKNRQRWADPATREKWLRSNTEAWKDADKKNDRVEKMRRHLGDPVAYSQRSQAQKDSWTSEHRQAQSDRLKANNPGELGRVKRWSKGGSRENHSIKMKEFWSDPVRRAALCKRRRVTILRKKNLSGVAIAKATLLGLQDKILGSQAPGEPTTALS